MSETAINNSEAFRKSQKVDVKKTSNSKPKVRPNTFIPKDKNFFDKNKSTVTEVYTDYIRD